VVIRPYDRDALKAEFDAAEPFRHILIDSLLDPDFAREAASCFPTFEEALQQGFAFDFVNERRKVQISDASKFPEPIARLHRALASPEFLADLEHITGIPRLLADETLAGGGMHVTGPHGRLDVHVDFNFAEERRLHRRLNVLVYMNPDWDDRWGGAVELWDRKVKRCHRTVMPRLGRCVLFETSDISFHGVQPLTCPEDVVRKSFAAYYYTLEPPPGWDGTCHGTIFRARPDEHLRRFVQMPAEKLWRRSRQALRALKAELRGRRPSS
jgi:Rps23 Pro-64 3,4-dihydroxylase Tpa1-like proline 4-hydroxylase